MRFRPQRKVKIKWSINFAYAIGLLTSDGCLKKDKRHIWFSSKDLEMIENLKQSLELKNSIGRYARGGERVKKYYYVGFGDVYFYKFLESIGLSSAKSKIISQVDVPQEYFADFLRGLFDGDGSFYTYWDKRWPNSFGFKLSFASASPTFINWLKKELTKFYDVKGYFHKGRGVINLEYIKGDSKKLFFAMYYSKNILFLNRKYIKIKSALEKDKDLGLEYLQKSRGSSVVRALA